jgi:hypothetical protein
MTGQVRLFNFLTTVMEGKITGFRKGRQAKSAGCYEIINVTGHVTGNIIIKTLATNVNK